MYVCYALGRIRARNWVIELSGHWTFGPIVVILKILLTLFFAWNCLLIININYTNYVVNVLSLKICICFRVLFLFLAVFLFLFVFFLMISPFILLSFVTFFCFVFVFVFLFVCFLFLFFVFCFPVLFVFVFLLPYLIVTDLNRPIV